MKIDKNLIEQAQQTSQGILESIERSADFGPVDARGLNAMYRSYFDLTADLCKLKTAVDRGETITSDQVTRLLTSINEARPVMCRVYLPEGKTLNAVVTNRADADKRRDEFFPEAWVDIESAIALPS